jgi:hypothetical protein
MNAVMTAEMVALNDAELEQVEGGIWQLAPIGFAAYKTLLDKIEANPDAYTWTMDWYYS